MYYRTSGLLLLGAWDLWLDWEPELKREIVSSSPAWKVIENTKASPVPTLDVERVSFALSLVTVYYGRVFHAFRDDRSQ